MEDWLIKRKLARRRNKDIVDVIPDDDWSNLFSKSCWRIRLADVGTVK